MTSSLNKILLTSLLFLLYFCGCAPDSKTSEKGVAEDHLNPPQTLTVFAAASLADVFREIERGFEHINPGVDVVLNLAGSQQLAHQISLGAPADVFAPASLKKMQGAIDSGKIAARTIMTFARNQLVVIVPIDNPAGLTTLQGLSRPDLKLVLAAEEVPAGQYTRQFLGKASACSSFSRTFSKYVLDHTVSFEQNVRAVRTKVALGEADAGIVYTSDVNHLEDMPIATIKIPQELNPVAHYPIAPLLDSPHSDLAIEFIKYVLSEEGQEILVLHGFISI